MYLCCAASVIHAQDIITKKNGDEIYAKVLEIGADDVTYKLFGNESGRTYGLSKSDLFMIKYKNGEVERFKQTPDANGAFNREEEDVFVGEEEASDSDSYFYFDPDATWYPDRTSVKRQKAFAKPFISKGYIGFGIGRVFPSGSYVEAKSGVQINVNIGYLFSSHVGIAATIFTTSFDLSNYPDIAVGLTGIMSGPLFSTASASGEWTFDLRPMAGFVTESITDKTAFSAGMGGSIRWNCGQRFSLSGNMDYYRGVVNEIDLSSFGITFGINFRF